MGYEQKNNAVGSSYGLTVKPMKSEGTASFRRYRYTGSDEKPAVADAMAVCIAATIIQPSYGTTFTNTSWIIPATVIYTAPDEATLEKYQTQYQMIFDNSLFRNEFAHIKQIYGNHIRSMVMKQQANSIAAMTEAQAQSYMSDFEEKNYTSDDWANDWSDFIYDRNEYTNSDGDTIKVSTQFDSVYQNGNQYYLGPDGSSPYGWDKLTPNR